MIKTLEERIAERKAEHDQLILAEHKAQRVIDALPTIFTNENDSIRTYENGLYVDLYPANVEIAELQILPVISELTKEKWNRRVDKEAVTYSLSHYTPAWYTNFRVYPKVEGTCRIIMRATGKTTRKVRYVEIEEPEIEYLVDCDPTGGQSEDDWREDR